MAKPVSTLVAVTSTARVAYTRPVVALFLGRCMADPNIDHDPSRHDGPPVLIRRRLLRVLAAMFAVLMGVAAVEGFWPGGAGSGMALAFLALCAIGVPVLMAHQTQPIIRDIQRLEDDRARLLDLYGRARQDSLLDGLTGLGNHRAFQEELRRQLEHATRHKSPLSLLLIDVDDLKTEQHHEAGLGVHADTAWNCERQERVGASQARIGDFEGRALAFCGFRRRRRRPDHVAPGWVCTAWESPPLRGRPLRLKTPLNRHRRRARLGQHAVRCFIGQIDHLPDQRLAQLFQEFRAFRVSECQPPALLFCSPRDCFERARIFNRN